MSREDLPFNARENDIFPTKIWIANLELLARHRQNLVADVLRELPGPAGGGSTSTGPVLQDRDDPWWSACRDAILTFTDALAGGLRPGWRHRSVHMWATALRRADDQRTPLDSNVTYQGATYSCFLWLQIPTELEGMVALAFRDPLFHLNERLGLPGYGDVVPADLRLLVFPGHLERFHRTMPIGGVWSQPFVTVSTDVSYY